MNARCSINTVDERFTKFSHRAGPRAWLAAGTFPLRGAPLCSPEATLPHPLSVAGISMSGMRAGLSGRTWAPLTMVGRFWMPPPGRRAKVRA